MRTRTPHRTANRTLPVWKASLALVLALAGIPGALAIHDGHADGPAAFEHFGSSAVCHPELGRHLEAPPPRKPHSCAACLHRLELSGLDLAHAETLNTSTYITASLAETALSLRSADVSASSSRGPPRC